MRDQRIGIFGGTFDPIHLGHLIIAEEVRWKLSLEEVLFVPTGQPWLKGEATISAAEHRLEMVLSATASNPYFSVSTIEIERDGSSYSVETVAELKASLGARAKLHFIVGQDALAELPRWKNPRRLVELCQVVAVGRPGHGMLDLDALEPSIPGASDRILLVDVPQIEISATDIRRRVASGLSIRYLVPEAVEKYIAEQGLYIQGG
ncbi:MAG: nicotinate-nucleotide adenylyltransferase [Chloroflexota bacterium]|nr:nicotinate-nucleotide adenylyltransferase [Chloroflexota bacterium]